MAKNRSLKHQFQFKQFTVHHDRCAMKVSSDACLLGAYVPVVGVSRILDVGTGSGLLALMLGQRTNATIDAIDICQPAVSQALENVAASPSKHRIKVVQAKVQEFSAPHQSGYDLIVANPPFYQNSLRSACSEKNQAWHADSLNFEDLCAAVDRLIKRDTGQFWALVPLSEESRLKNTAREHRLWLFERVALCHKSTASCNRIIAGFSAGPVSTVNQVVISRYEEDGLPSQVCRNLLKDFMLHY